jgi:hypothetical protein
MLPRMRGYAFLLAVGCIVALLWWSFAATSKEAPASAPALPELGSSATHARISSIEAEPDRLRLAVGTPVESVPVATTSPSPRVVARRSDGRPAVGVDVVAWLGLMPGDEIRSSDKPFGNWTSEQDGVVPVPASLLEVLRDGRVDVRFAADVPLSARGLIRARIDGTGLVVVPVPDTAALHVEVSEAAGERWNRRGRLVFKDGLGAGWRSNYRTIADGEVRVPHVACGRVVTFTLDGLNEYEELEVELPPLTKGEGERTHRVLLRAKHPIGIVRFVAENGAPLGGARGLVSPACPPVTADAGGMARVVLRGFVEHEEPVVLHFEMQHRNGTRDLEGEVLVPAPLRATELALGDVVLRPRTCLVAGRMLFTDGAPLEFADLAIVGRDERGRWHGIDAAAMTGSDGSFLIPPGIAGLEGWREVAVDLPTRSHWQLAAPVPFEVGQRNLEVTVPKPVSIVGSIRWEGPDPVPALDVLWTRSKGPPLRVRQLPSGHFNLANVAPGTGSIVVVTNRTTDPLVETRVVSVAAGDASEQDFTVGAGVQDLRFTIANASGARGEWSYDTNSERTFEHAPTLIEPGVYRILTRAWRVDLLWRESARAGSKKVVIEDLRTNELLELGPGGPVRSR